MSKSRYSEWEPFHHIYLEDSYVLDILDSPGKLSFVVEAVLTEGHPEYCRPDPDKQSCYRYGEIEFTNVSKLCWVERNSFPVVGPSGEMDFGNIDVFIKSGEEYELEGEWGHIKLSSSTVQFRLLDANYKVTRPKFLEHEFNSSVC